MTSEFFAQRDHYRHHTFSPTVTGNYALIIENNGCIDTTACYLVDFSSLNELEEVMIYPNSRSGEFFTISSDDVILGVQVLDLLRRSLDLSFNASNNTVNVSSLSPRKYFVSVTKIKGLARKEIVVQR